MSERNIYSDSPVPSHGSEGGTKKKTGKGMQIQIAFFFSFTTGAFQSVWHPCCMDVSLCEMTTGFAGNVGHYCIRLPLP